METQVNDLNTKLSAIDKALAQAKARKAAKEGTPVEASDMSTKTKTKGPKVKVEAADKVAAKLAKDAVRMARRQQLTLERTARREAKATERAQAKTPHMKKIEKAAAALPEMSNSMTLTFNEVTTNFSAEQINALALHLQHFNRVKATERALAQKIEAGQTVRLISGPTKYVGMMGTVAKAQRIRCFVEIPGFKKPVYLFTSDVEIVEEAMATGTEG